MTVILRPSLGLSDDDLVIHMGAAGRAVEDVEDLTDAELAALDTLLGPSVEEMLPLFLPRRTT